MRSLWSQASWSYFWSQRRLWGSACAHGLRLSLQRLKGDLHHLRVDLDQLTERCHIFLHKSPTGSSTPRLRSELDLLVEKMDQVYGLSAVYLDK